MAGGKSPKTKGQNGERELAKIFGNVFGGSFQRVVGSGAFVGGKNAFRKSFLTDTQKKATKGDIITDDILPKLVIEVKNYAEFPFHQLILGSCSKLDIWLEQNAVACEENDVPVIAMKINRCGWYLCIETKYNLVADNYVIYKQYMITELISCLEKNKELLISICN